MSANCTVMLPNIIVKLYSVVIVFCAISFILTINKEICNLQNRQVTQTKKGEKLKLQTDGYTNDVLLETLYRIHGEKVHSVQEIED